MKIILLVLASLFLHVLYAQLPKDIINQKCFDSGWTDETEDMLLTDDAMYFLGNQITDDGNNNYEHNIVFFKTNLNGEKIWLKTFGGTAYEQSMTVINDDEGFLYFSAGTASNDGDVQSGNLGGFDVWIVKLDTSGVIIWEKTFGGTANDWGAYLLYLENGNILVYGSTHSSDIDVNTNYGSLDFWIFEITTNGEIINSRVFGSSANDNIFNLIQTSDGGFFSTARAGASDGIANGNYHANGDMWLLKLDENLNIEWQKIIGGSQYDSGGYGLVQLEDGGYIINGDTQSFDGDIHGFDFPNDPNQADIWVIRIDSIGNILWDIALGGDDWEHSSKVFVNEDGSFTVFGSTSSMDNGDVEGNHYYVYNPTYPGYDIWMVHLSEGGEMLDQRCFGNAARNIVRRGVIKKSDSHYLIAGTGASRQADPSQPEAPTEGEVWGGYTSTSKDIWFFEAVDCNYFQPSIPANIEGEDSVCSNNSSQNTYTTQVINPQYEEAQWLLEPAEAGELTNLQDSVIIQWNTTFEGQAALSVRSISNCGESEYSPAKLIQVEICLGLGEINKKSLFLYPNPATSQITFELPNINKQSQLLIKDIYGKVIATLKIEPNQSKLIWECSGVASGVYFYEGEIGGEVYRGKLVVQ